MIGAKIKELRNELGISQAELAKRISVSQQTIGSWETNRSEPNLDALKKLASIFNTSVDYIIGNSKKRHYYDLTKKDEIDIAEQAEQIIEGIQTSADVNFYGEPATKEQMASMRDIIETGLRINKEKAKKKFTPKKYRDNGAKGGD